ncbi:MAG: molybdopterin-dependent oxidoreductase [Planctomycetes bacterium]|jgi:putative selenate reductase molybdopterin-binding subunit|nr:molybdopterin-dependent oxidoreductase [Planctomycetota bacterium]HON44160.1 molybdopterin-dependent oxidoreductase [Planctomycetota bacterium]HPY74540.1 molybdopterin-dependent oxidoreductase [Planctomycetota bacterium]HQB00184.1 molybdopterin-dependent oxidoreductase [Planctomycetota bacterium]HRU51073.1 molybdopterin-dependent oxidoreductase [Planctomycetota bacterium]
MKIQFTLNGKKCNWEVKPSDKVHNLLRSKGYLSVRVGCDAQGMCGSCAILLNGKLVNSCLLLAPQLDGKEVSTAEGLADGRKLHVIQTAFLDAGVVQCGYCMGSMMNATKELLSKTLEPTREQIQNALSGIFCRCTGYEQLYQAVDLAAKRLRKYTMEGTLHPEYANHLRWVGKATQKVDGTKLVTFEPAFVEDMVQPNSLHVYLLKSPHAHAYIEEMDISEAESMEGVAYILSYKNAPTTYYSSAGQGYPEPSPYDKRVMDRTVRYVGDRVAAVAAESFEQAKAAAEKIKVQYKILPACLSIAEASKEGAPQVNVREEYCDPLPIGADPTKNIAASTSGGIGDIEKGLEEADVIIENTYITKPVQCTPLEPHICYTYLDNDRLIIRASTQVPWHLRRVIATLLDIPETKVRVIKEKLGGGFGAKQDIVLEDIAAWITWQTGKPVYFRYNRAEEFISSRIRHPMEITIKLGAKKDGTLTAINMEVLADTGAYGAHCLTVPMNACSKTLPLFTCPNIHYNVKVYYTNLPIAGAYQGYGAPQGSFAMQVACAELCNKLNIDLYDFLQKNRVYEGYHLEILKSLGEGQEGIAQKISTCGLEAALKRGYELIEWNKKEVSDDPNIKIGKGAVIIQQGSGLPGIDAANARIDMNLDGTFQLLIGGTDLGTGLDTMAVKIAAECLQVDVSHFAIIAADTDVTPFDVGAYASSGTYFTGSAVFNTAKQMKEKILQAASEYLQEPIQNLSLEFPHKVISTTGKEVQYAQLSAHAHSGVGKGQLTAAAGFTTEEAPIPYGAHFAQVSVNIRTGEIKVDKYYAIQDCGTPINPDLALGQVYGGVMKAIGHSLWEEMKYDENGKCINPNFLDYKVPMFKDIPTDFKVELLPILDDPLGPYGAKSIAEISLNGSAGVLAIAIHDAIGIWIRDWPFTPEKIIQRLKQQS